MFDIHAEQIEAVKEWWHKYGNLTVVIIAILALVIFGWQFWQKRQITNATQASLLYEQMQAAQMAKQAGQVEFIAERLEKDYAATVYSPLAALLQAQNSIANNDLRLATKQLQWIVDHAHNKTLLQIARIRLARVLIAQQQADVALKVLKNVDDKNYLPLINTITGDALLALNKPQEARAAYQTALDSLPDSNPMRQWVAMKLENNL